MLIRIFYNLISLLIIYKFTIPVGTTMYHIFYNLIHKFYYRRSWSNLARAKSQMGYHLLQSEMHMFIVSSFLGTLSNPRYLMNTITFINRYYRYLKIVSKDYIDEIHDLNQVAQRFTSLPNDTSILGYMMAIRTLNEPLVDSAIRTILSFIPKNSMTDLALNFIPAPSKSNRPFVANNYDIEVE